MMENKKEEKKSSVGTGCLLLLVIVVGIFLIYFLSAIIEEDKKFREKPIPYVTSEDTIDRVIEGVAIKAFGKTVDWDDRPYTVKEITKYKQTAGLDEGGYLIEVSYRANENLTVVSLMRSGIFMDAIEFTKELYLPSFCEEIKIYMLKPHLILIDKYGKEKEEQVAKLVLRRAIANKVNWENITTSAMFERILRNEGQLWIHPALSK